jgi:hypothetical protein
MLAGACKTASAGCAAQDPSRDMTSLAAEQGVPLLDEMDGHAGVSAFVADGFELVIY